MLPAASRSLRTSSGFTSPSQVPINRVTTDFRMFSRACWTVRKYDPPVSGLPASPLRRRSEAIEAAYLYFISPMATLM